MHDYKIWTLYRIYRVREGLLEAPQDDSGRNTFLDCLSVDEAHERILELDAGGYAEYIILPVSIKGYAPY